MKKYWSQKAASLVPYIAGEQPKEKLIKLNTNENAFPPSPQVARAVLENLDHLQLYPNPNADSLRESIAKKEALPSDCVFCSNGSDEALALCFMAFFDPGTPINVPDVTYSFYSVWADLFDLTLHHIPLKEDFSIDVPSMKGAKGVVLANPNAPTGIALPLAQIEELVASTDGICIIDEAYVAFGAESARPLLDRHDNVVIVRTLSKSHSLAGMRVGYVLASPELICALTTVKDSFNSYPLDTLAQAAAIAALQDTEYYDKITSEIIKTREYTVQKLKEMGLFALPSSANFLFVDCKGKAEEVFDALRNHGILVRYFPKGRTQPYLRITIGTMEEMKQFVFIMEQIWSRL